MKSVVVVALLALASSVYGATSYGVQNSYFNGNCSGSAYGTGYAQIGTCIPDSTGNSSISTVNAANHAVSANYGNPTCSGTAYSNDDNGPVGVCNSTGSSNSFIYTSASSAPSITGQGTYYTTYASCSSSQIIAQFVILNGCYALDVGGGQTFYYLFSCNATHTINTLYANAGCTGTVYSNTVDLINTTCAYGNIESCGAPVAPTGGPTTAPTAGPTSAPTAAPTAKPTTAPTTGTVAPTTGTAAPTTGTAAPTTGTAAPTTGTAAPSTTGTPTAAPATTRGTTARTTTSGVSKTAVSSVVLALVGAVMMF